MGNKTGGAKFDGGREVLPAKTRTLSTCPKYVAALFSYPLEPQVFDPSTPGYLTGPGAREAAGLPKGSGPYKVITDLAVMGYDDATCRMQVESLHPGVSLSDVHDRTGFELLVREPVGVTLPPTEEQLCILRTEVDPHRYVLGR